MTSLHTSFTPCAAAALTERDLILETNTRLVQDQNYLRVLNDSMKKERLSQIEKHAEMNNTIDELLMAVSESSAAATHPEPNLPTAPPSSETAPCHQGKSQEKSWLPPPYQSPEQSEAESSIIYSEIDDDEKLEEIGLMIASFDPTKDKSRKQFSRIGLKSKILG